MNAGQILDRTFSELIYPGDVNRPPFEIQSGGFAAGALTLNVTGRLGADAIPDDGVLEGDSECVLVQSVAGTAVTIARRGWLETDDVIHSAGTLWWLDPDYTRTQCLNALATVVQTLNGYGLYATAVETTTVSFGAPHALPSAAQRVLEVRVQGDDLSYTPLREGYHYIVHDDVSPIEVQWTRSMTSVNGASVRIQYATDFTAPTTESSDLTTAGVPVSLQPYLTWAIAGHLLAGREPTRVQIEAVERIAASANVPVGSMLNVGSALTRAFEQLHVQRERKLQRRKRPARIRRVW